MTQTPSANIAACIYGTQVLSPANHTEQRCGAERRRQKAIPLNTNKLPFGGVMAPIPVMPDQSTVLALAQASHSMRMGNMIYTNGLASGPRPSLVASQPQPASTKATTGGSGDCSRHGFRFAGSSSRRAFAGDAGAAPYVDAFLFPIMATPPARKTQIPQALMDDMAMMKALNQYSNFAGMSSTGAKLDVTN